VGKVQGGRDGLFGGARVSFQKERKGFKWRFEGGTQEGSEGLLG
jgi:hypothetical protein